jgi:hypothetical protein
VKNKTISPADLLPALRAAEEFISDELERREHSCAPEGDEYTGAASRTLRSVREAITEAGGN